VRVLSVITVGNVGMNAQELVDNVMACVHAFLAELPSRNQLCCIPLSPSFSPLM
jgi:ribosomal protein L1